MPQQGRPQDISSAPRVASRGYGSAAGPVSNAGSFAMLAEMLSRFGQDFGRRQEREEAATTQHQRVLEQIAATGKENRLAATHRSDLGEQQAIAAAERDTAAGRMQAEGAAASKQYPGMGVEEALAASAASIGKYQATIRQEMFEAGRPFRDALLAKEVNHELQELHSLAYLASSKPKLLAGMRGGLGSILEKVDKQSKEALTNLTRIERSRDMKRVLAGKQTPAFFDYVNENLRSLGGITDAVVATGAGTYGAAGVGGVGVEVISRDTAFDATRPSDPSKAAALSDAVIQHYFGANPKEQKWAKILLEAGATGQFTLQDGTKVVADEAGFQKFLVAEGLTAPPNDFLIGVGNTLAYVNDEILDASVVGNVDIPREGLSPEQLKLVDQQQQAAGIRHEGIRRELGRMLTRGAAIVAPFTSTAAINYRIAKAEHAATFGAARDMTTGDGAPMETFAKHYAVRLYIAAYTKIKGLQARNPGLADDPQLSALARSIHSLAPEALDYMEQLSRRVDGVLSSEEMGIAFDMAIDEINRTDQPLAGQFSTLGKSQDRLKAVQALALEHNRSGQPMSEILAANPEKYGALTGLEAEATDVLQAAEQQEQDWFNRLLGTEETVEPYEIPTDAAGKPSTATKMMDELIRDYAKDRAAAERLRLRDVGKAKYMYSLEASGYVDPDVPDFGDWGPLRVGKDRQQRAKEAMGPVLQQTPFQPGPEKPAQAAPRQPAQGPQQQARPNLATGPPRPQQPQQPQRPYG